MNAGVSLLKPSDQISARPSLEVIESLPHASHVAYRPDIDGLRAIAVMSVVIYHLFPTLIPGGFIGVDIFFVISGYLISSIIMKDLSQGQFSFRSFYTRRVKRIFPTLLLVLTSVGLLGWLVLLPAEFVSLTKSMKYTTVFTTNWHLFKTASYFDSAADLKPLLHIWSLSIEEQFYIIFPLLLAALYKWARNWLPHVLMAGLSGSFLLNLWFIPEQPQQVFYMLPYRAWELLIGAILACYGIQQHMTHKGLANILSLVGMGLIASACWILCSKDPFPGYWALLPTIGAALLIISPQAVFNRYILANPALVWVGLISYSLYLWHWPLMSFAHILGHNTITVCIGILISSNVLAAATTFLIERPVRKGSDKWLYGLCVPMLTIGVITSVLSKSPVQTYPKLSLSGDALSKFEAATKDWDHDSVNLVMHPKRGFPFRSYGQGSHVVMFFGDSNMKQYWPRIEKVLQDQDFLKTYTALFATRHGQFPCSGYGKTQEARDFLEDAEKCLDDSRVKTVVICASWIGYEDKEPEDSQKRYSDFKQMLERIRAQGKTVYLILNIPVVNESDPMQRLDRGLFFVRPRSEQSFFMMEYVRGHWGMIHRLTTIADETGSIIIDPVLTMCPAGQCQLLHGDGLPTYKDGCHLTATYVRDNATFIDRIFNRQP